MLLEPLPVVPSVAIFGVGHVGLELARILARHDLDLHLVDSRSAHLTEAELAPLADAVAAVHAHHVPVLPELVLAELPPGTRVLVLTHDHAEDLAIVDAALRCDHLGADRADRLLGQVGPVPDPAARVGPGRGRRPRRDADRAARRHVEQGAGGDRGLGRGGAARRVRARGRAVGPAAPVTGRE